MQVNHSLLCALGVGHSALTAVVESASRSGWAAKLTGAGGGGCAFVVLTQQLQTGGGDSGVGSGEQRERECKLAFAEGRCLSFLHICITESRILPHTLLFISM